MKFWTDEWGMIRASYMRCDAYGTWGVHDGSLTRRWLVGLLIESHEWSDFTFSSARLIR